MYAYAEMLPIAELRLCKTSARRALIDTSLFSCRSNWNSRISTLAFGLSKLSGFFTSLVRMSWFASLIVSRARSVSRWKRRIVLGSLIARDSAAACTTLNRTLSSSIWHPPLASSRFLSILRNHSLCCELRSTASELSSAQVLVGFPDVSHQSHQ